MITVNLKFCTPRNQREIKFIFRKTQTETIFYQKFLAKGNFRIGVLGKKENNSNGRFEMYEGINRENIFRYMDKY